MFITKIFVSMFQTTFKRSREIIISLVCNSNKMKKRRKSGSSKM